MAAKRPVFVEKGEINGIKRDVVEKQVALLKKAKGVKRTHVAQSLLNVVSPSEIVSKVALHYAVKIGQDEECDWYEVSNTEENEMLINRWKDHERKKRDYVGNFYLAGSTTKSDDEIEAFNKQWLLDHPLYNATSENCQEFVHDFVEFLCPGANKCEIPLASDFAWDSTGSTNQFAISSGGLNEVRISQGKAGKQTTAYKVPIAVESEGMSGGARANFQESGVSIGFDASLLRKEAQVGLASVKLEPNVNTGISTQHGYSVKLLGNGVTVKKDGVGVHTSLGSFGFGKF